MYGLSTISRRSFMIMPLAFAACKPRAALFEVSGLTMGTTYNVVVVDSPSSVRESDVRYAVETALAQVNGQMSNWDADSEISQFNAQTSLGDVAVSDDLHAVMAAAEQVSTASDGRFDTTLGPLIELWGFGATGTRGDAPSAMDIEAAHAKAGHANSLEIGAGRMRKTQADAQVYLAAIGKGYGADAVGKSLQALGIKDFMVEIGGDLYASGRNVDGLAWRIGVETPQTRSGVMDVVGVSNLGMASSGDYRNYFEQDGVRYSHVIDPKTGRPITHRTASATVLADNGMLADAWATAMLTLGAERGMEIAKEHSIAVMFIDRDTDYTDMRFKSVASPRFEELRA